MRNWQKWNALTLGTLATLAVVASASPAAAAAVDSTTTVQASPTAPVTGQLVALNAKVDCTGDPSLGLGVSFFDGQDLLATAPVGTDGTSTLRTGFISTGEHEITAAFNGDDNCNASSSKTTVEVSDASTSPTNPSAPCFLLCGLLNLNVSNIGNNVGNDYIGNNVGRNYIGNNVGRDN